MSDGLADCSPVAVFLVSSGPRGDRLLFRYPIQESISISNTPLVIAPQNRFLRKINQQVENYCISSKSAWSGFERFIKDGQLTGYADETLAHLLAVKNTCCGRAFMVKINDVVFAGHPMQYEEWETLGGVQRQIKVYINIVFALRDSITRDIIESYQQLSRLLSTSLIREDSRCSYLSGQKQIMWAIHDELPGLSTAGDVETDEEQKAVYNSYERVLTRCCLARCLKIMFEDLKKKRSINVHINKWIHLSFCVAPRKQMNDATGCLESLRPHMGLLLLEDKKTILGDMKPNPSPLFLQFLRMASPRKNFIQMAFSADLTLSQVFLLAKQLIYWGKAVVIYPIRPSNVYLLNPSGSQIGTTSPLIPEFSKTFPNDSLTLFHVAALFSRPTKLSSHVRPLSTALQASDSTMRRSSRSASLSAAPSESAQNRSARAPLRQLSGRWDGNELVIYSNTLENNRGGHLGRPDSTNRIPVVHRRDYRRPDNVRHDDGRQSISCLDSSYNSEQFDNESELKGELAESWSEEAGNKSIYNSGQYSNTPKTSYEILSGEKRAELLRDNRFGGGTAVRGNQSLQRRRVTSAMTPTLRQTYLDSYVNNQDVASSVSRASNAGELSRSNPALNHYQSQRGSDTPVTPLMHRDYFQTAKQPQPAASSDYVLASAGYWCSTEARNTAAPDFKQQQYVRHSITGRDSPSWPERQQKQQYVRHSIAGRDSPSLPERQQKLRRDSLPSKQLQRNSRGEVEGEAEQSERVKSREAFKCCSEIVAWLLHRGLIGQLHTFVRLFVPPSSHSSDAKALHSTATNHPQRFTPQGVPVSTKYTVHPVLSDRKDNTVSNETGAQNRDGNSVSKDERLREKLEFCQSPSRQDERKKLTENLYSDINNPQNNNAQPIKRKLSEINISENAEKVATRPRASTMTTGSTEITPGGTSQSIVSKETIVTTKTKRYSHNVIERKTVTEYASIKNMSEGLTIDSSAKDKFDGNKSNILIIGSLTTDGNDGANDGRREDRSLALYRVADSVLAQAGLTREQIEGVYRCAASQDPNSLALFVRLARYFDGTVPVDVMAFYENTPISHVVSTIDKFRDVLFTFQHVVKVNTQH